MGEMGIGNRGESKNSLSIFIQFLFFNHVNDSHIQKPKLSQMGKNQIKHKQKQLNTKINKRTDLNIKPNHTGEMITSNNFGT